LGCLVTTPSYWQLHPQYEAWTAAKAIHAVVEKIIGVESNGDPNAKNKRSSATGLGQFLDETWLEMIGAHRPDLAKGRSQAEIAHRIAARYFPGQDRYRAALDPRWAPAAIIDNEKPSAAHLVKLDAARVPAAVATALRRLLAGRVSR